MWNIENATQCTAGGGWSGAKATKGEESVDALTRPTTYKSYTLSCTGPGGTKSSSVSVKLISLPTGTFSVSPTVVSYNGESKLSWSPSSDTTSCTASGGWSGSKSITTGQEIVRGLQKTTTYIITCTGPGGLIEKSATVKHVDTIRARFMPENTYRSAFLRFLRRQQTKQRK